MKKNCFKKTNLKRYIALILVFALMFQTGIKYTNANESQETQVHTAYKVRDMYNMAIPIRFDGEDEYLNGKVTETNDITNIELIDNTYNKSEYSVREYYRAVSNQTLNLRTVYLSENDNKFTSIKLAHTRGYYSPKTDENPEGYTTDKEYRRLELLRDWSNKVQEAVDNGAKLKNMAGEEIGFDKLDSDNDGYIDAITVLFTPTDAKYASSWDGGTIPLWAYHTINNRITIKTAKGTLTSNRYNQAPIQNDPVSIYKEAGSDIYFVNNKTLIHEMGHIFGLLDLYTASGKSEPVCFMSAMAKALSPVVQFMTSREREAVGWLDADNITPITKAGEYTLPPTKDKRQDGTVAYTLELPNNHKLYLEYRYVDDREINRFDLNAQNRKIYNLLGNYVSANGLKKSGLLVCDSDMSVRFPKNLSGVTQLSAIGGQYNTRIDAPMSVGEDITYGGYTISVTELTKEKITFNVSGKEIDGEQPTEQPENTGKPTANGVTLLAPSEVGGNLQMTAVRGSQIQFLAQINGKKISDGDIKWYVSGETAADTEIDYETGLLKIGAFESPTSVLKVVGKSEKNDEKTITINVNVKIGKKTYSVTYLPGNDVVGSVESISKLQDTSLNLKAALYTKTGYTQTGWSLSEGGEKTYDLNGEYKENEAIKLYPYWSKSEKPTETASAKPSQTEKPTETASAKPGQTEKPTETASAKPSQTEKPTETASAKPGQTEKPTETASAKPSQTEKPTETASAKPSQTAEPNETASAKPGQTEKPTETASAKPGQTEKPTETASAKPGQTEKPTETVGAKPGQTEKPTETASAKPSQTEKPTETASAKPGQTEKPTEETASAKPGQTEKPTETAGAKPGQTEKPTETASAKPGQTAEPTETTEPNETTTPTVSPNSMVKLNKTSVVLYLPKYKTFTLIAKVDGKSVKANFKSSNPKIVKVNAAGKLTAVKSGKAVVKVTVNGKKFICKVTVKKISLKIKPVKRTLYLKGNKSIRLKTIVTGPYRKVRYKSSNKNIVKVNGKGKVTAVRKGKAKITVTANGIKKKCRITVLSVKRKKHKG